MRTREEMVRHLQVGGRFENHVLIVGGGINGIGLYRDLALQGIPAVLVEKGDFASGTSAASSRLIHGGLRYLETGEFGLVRESVVERNALLANAPHLVRPLPVFVPAYSYFGGLLSAGLRFLKLKKTPGPKGIAAVKIGLTFFDRFSRGNGSMPEHRVLSARQGRRKIPGLSESVRAVAQYYDTRIVHPEWLALELIEDAESDCPRSLALNYMEVAASDADGVVLRDAMSGSETRIAPRAVVNCGGAWADAVNGRLGLETRLMGGTQGSHLVLERPDLAAQLADGMIYFETPDFRACLIYAIDERHVLMGTTDIRADDPDRAVCSQEEIDYIFSVTSQVLPGADFRREQIVYTYAGIRPLPASSDETTGAISRDHQFRLYAPEGDRAFPVLVLVGGKWTTYRACAEQALADSLFETIGETRRKSTLHVPVGGGRAFSDAERGALSQRLTGTGLAGAAEKLLERYGSKAPAVAKAMATDGERTVAETGYHEGEIAWLVDTGRVARLADIVLRRTRLPFDGAIDRAALDAISRICANRLGWSEERRLGEVDDVTAILRERHLTQVA